MGLDTSHNAWHGAYSSFHQWRVWLAKQIGIDLEESWSKNIPINHAIEPLLNHSDCDGELSPKESKRIAEGLEQIISQLPEPTNIHEEYLIEKTIQFKKGCELAYIKNEIIDFH